MNCDQKACIFMGAIIALITCVFYCSWLCARLDALHKDVVETKLMFMDLSKDRKR